MPRSKPRYYSFRMRCLGCGRGKVGVKKKDGTPMDWYDHIELCHNCWDFFVPIGYYEETYTMPRLEDQSIFVTRIPPKDNK